MRFFVASNKKSSDLMKQGFSVRIWSKSPSELRDLVLGMLVPQHGSGTKDVQRNGSYLLGTLLSRCVHFCANCLRLQFQEEGLIWSTLG